MISEELRKAREYEEREGAKITARDRPAFHLSPLVGWLNDPNGFSYYGGKYHLFYQYHPYSSHWGPMHWGHAVSDDLITWEYLPAALAPDNEYDKSGCFSGSAITLPDGRQLIMYTGCGSSEDDPLGRGRWIQSQCIAVSKTSEDGSTEYVKYEGNPVLTGADLPDDADPYEFRDPYMWRASDGTYRMLAANGVTGEITDEGCFASDKGTQISMFSSVDGFNWKYDKVIFEDHLKIGVMWECPNFFELDGKYVLIASPMDMIAEADDAEGSVRFPKGNNVCYITGSYDEENEEFTPDTSRRKSALYGIGSESTFDLAATTKAVLPDGQITKKFYRYEPVDYGLDFYAPQVMKAPDGRTIMIGWMQDPKSALMHVEKDFKTFGQMTVPRELSFRNGTLCQWPVRELESYRGEPVVHKNIELAAETIALEGVQGAMLDLEISVGNSSNGCDASYSEFCVCIAEDEDHSCSFTYCPDRFGAKLERGQSGVYSWNKGERTVRITDQGGNLELRILVDKHSAEIFINGGEQVMSFTFYSPLSEKNVTFSALGTVSLDVTAYPIRANA